MPCGKTLSRDKTGPQTLTYHYTLSHGGFRRRLSRGARFPGRPFTTWSLSKMEANDVENLHAALCHHLPNFQALLAALAHVSLSSMVRRVPL